MVISHLNQKKILLISALPGRSPFLQDVSEEIWQIANVIFGSQRSSIDNEFEPINWANVDETKLFALLKSNSPDIIHFAGHGGKDGILLEDGTEHGKSLSAEELNNILSVNEKKYELIFLNSCFSENQAKELEKHSDYIIAITGEIEQGIARIFAENFYKEYKETKDVVKSYKNTMLKDKINYHRIRQLQKLYPEDKFIDQTLEDAVSKLSPFEKTIEDFDIKVIQSKKMPAALESRIRQVIRNHDESAINIEKPSDLKKEFNDIYEILFELILTGSEYGINHFFIKSGDLVQQTKMINEKILKELENKVVLNDKDLKEYKQTYDDTVSRFFKKIFYNLNVDKIENIEPMVPKDSYYNFFGEIVSIMHSILKSLSIMRGKTKQLFLIKNAFYRNYVIKRLYGFITYIEYDTKYLTQLLWEELNLDINGLKSEDQENFSTLVSDLKSLWQNIQQNKKSISIIKINLENTINIEEKIMKLFRRIIFSSLEYDYKTPINIDTKSKAFKQEIKPAITQNDVKSYSSDYSDVLAKLSDGLYDTPDKFFKILTDLINKMNEQYEICYNKSRFNKEDIKPLKEMYEKLNLQKTYLTDYSGKYQYLFSGNSRTM